MDAPLQLEVPLHKLIQAGKKAFFNNPALSDITLVCPDGRTIYCHSVILASASRRFANVLKPGCWTPGQQLPVRGVDSEALVTLLRAFYTGECPLQLEGLHHLYDAAVKLEVPSLASALEHFVSSCLAPDTALSLLQRCLALGPGLQHLADAVMDWLAGSATEVLGSPAFGSCPLDTVAVVCRGLARRNQLLGLQAAVSWLGAAPGRASSLLPLAAQSGLAAEAIYALAASGASLRDVAAVLGLQTAALPPAAAADQAEAAAGRERGAAKPERGEGGGGGGGRVAGPALDVRGNGVLSLEAVAGQGGGGAGLGARKDDAAAAAPLRLLPVGQDSATTAAPPPLPLPLVSPLPLPLPLSLSTLDAGSTGDAAAGGGAAGGLPGLDLPLSALAPLGLGLGLGLGGGSGLLLGGLGLAAAAGSGDGGGGGGAGPQPAADAVEGSGSAASTTSGLPGAQQQGATQGPRRGSAAGGGGGGSRRRRGGGGGRGGGEDDEDYQPGRDSEEEGGWGWGGRGRGGPRARTQAAACTPAAMASGAELSAGLGSLDVGSSGGGGGGGSGGGQDGGGDAGGERGRRASWRPAPAKGSCHVEGCGASLLGLRAYYQRHNTCEYHAKADSVLRDGVPHRFCQQCGRFQPLSEFDGLKRSCRVMLQRHYDRHCSRRGRQSSQEAELAMLQ